MQGLALSLQQKQKTTQFQKLATTLLALQGQDLDEYIRQQSDEIPLIEVAYPSPSTLRASGRVRFATHSLSKHAAKKTVRPIHYNF